MELNLNLEGLFSLFSLSLVRPESTKSARGVGCPLSWRIHSFLSSFFLELGFGRLLPIPVPRDSTPTPKKEVSCTLNHLFTSKSPPECLHHQRVTWPFFTAFLTLLCTHSCLVTKVLIWGPFPPLTRNYVLGIITDLRVSLTQESVATIMELWGCIFLKEGDQTILWADLQSRMNIQTFGK